MSVQVNHLPGRSDSVICAVCHFDGAPFRSLSFFARLISTLSFQIILLMIQWAFTPVVVAFVRLVWLCCVVVTACLWSAVR